MLEVLLDKGAKLDIVNAEGVTPVEQACFSGDLQSVIAILSKLEEQKQTTPLLLLHAAAG